ncbi:MAG: DUF192 domain-containing protein [Clostridia bacterium]|nr:DUF192 domain-containing protein [Clostridia bacterium]MBQ3006062.1 DUF192 domain-containing protein [Clostridia bacterium]
MKRASIKNNGRLLTANAELADSFFRRFMGLMFRKSVADDYALYITPCNQIHMLNMRFAIDAVYLDAEGRTVRIDENIQPGKICKTVRNAKSVIEMNAFTARKLGFREGDFIEIVRDCQ